MAQILRTMDGRLLLVGGRFLTVGAGSALPPVGSGTLTLTLDDFKGGNTAAEPVVQRAAGTDYGNVPVLYTFTGEAPVNPQARVVDADSGAIIKDWASLTSVSVAGSTGLGVLSLVPIGADYLLQIRDGNNTATVSNGSQRWGVGVCVAAFGQSNMVGTLHAGAYGDIVPGTSQSEAAYFQGAELAGVYFGPNGFVVPAGGSGTGSTASGSNVNTLEGGTLAFLRIAGAALKTKYGRKIPVCLMPWAFDSNGIDSFLPGGTNYVKLFGGSGTTAGTIGFASPRNYWAGDIEGAVMHQGEANNAMSRAQYSGKLRDMYTALLNYVQPFGRTAQNLFFLPAVLGVYQTTSVANIENIRGAILDFDAYARANGWPKARAGWNCIDCDPATDGDGSLHFSGTAALKSHRRMMQSVLHMLDCATTSGIGPRLTTATRSGDVATVTVTHEGGTALAAKNGAAALTGWLANTAADFTGTDIAVTATVASANTVAVTFTGGTAYPTYLKYMGGRVGNVNSYHPDASNLIYDNVQYPTDCTGTDLHTGLPLLPTPDAIEVA